MKYKIVYDDGFTREVEDEDSHVASTKLGVEILQTLANGSDHVKEVTIAEEETPIEFNREFGVVWQETHDGTGRGPASGYAPICPVCEKQITLGDEQVTMDTDHDNMIPFHVACAVKQIIKESKALADPESL